jgi:hypothetical protein
MLNRKFANLCHRIAFDHTVVALQRMTAAIMMRRFDLDHYWQIRYLSRTIYLTFYRVRGRASNYEWRSTNAAVAGRQ